MFRNKKLLSVISVLMIFTFVATPALALTDAVLDSTTNVESIDGLHSNYTTINTVKQDNVNVTTEWTKFNVKSGETLDTNFQGQNQDFLIRVTGSDMSTIRGSVISSGVGAGTSSTTMINPNGWYVGPGGLINVQSLLMTTQNFVGGDLVDVAGDGKIEMNGATVLTAQDAMFVASQAIINNSNITAGSKVQLVTADGMNFDLQQSGNISLPTSLTKATTSASPAMMINNSNITGSDVNMAARVDGLASNQQAIVITGDSAIRATNGDVYIVAKADTGFSNITAYDSKIEASSDVYAKNYNGNINFKEVELKNQNTKLEAKDGNINLNTICVEGGKFDALTTNGDVNDTASNFKNADATFTTKTGKVHLSSTKLDNTELELRNTNGLISVNNVNLTNKSFLNTLTNAKVEVNNLTADNSRAKLRSFAGDVDVDGLTNTNNSYTEVESVEGDISVSNSSNINNSTLNIARRSNTTPPTPGTVSVTDMTNGSKSYLSITNQKGDINVDNLDHQGQEFKFEADGIANIDNSTINAKVASSKAGTLNLMNTTLGSKAQIELFDGNMYLDNVTADANLKTASLSNKNGEVQIVNSAFNDLEVTSTGDATISTTTADKMTIDADNIMVHNLTNKTLINNAKAKGYAQFEGDGSDATKGGVKFNNITAGDTVLVHGGTIETENGSGTVNAKNGITLWTENQDVNLQSLAGKTLDVDFEGNEVLASTDGGYFDIQTSDRQTLTIDQKLDDTGLDRDFILGAGQIVYPRTGLALKSAGTATLIDKKDDIDVRVSSDDADTISLDNFEVGHLNVNTDGANSGDIYVYMPVDTVNTSFDAKSPTEFVYYIYPPAPTLLGDDEVNKISSLAGDLSSQAPTPVVLGTLVPLGAAAKFDANAKKFFVSLEDDGGKIVEYRVLKGLPYDSTKKGQSREIY